MSNETEAEKTAAQKRSVAEVRQSISSTRRELAETLDALEYKFDVPARFGEWADDRKVQAKRMWNDNPPLVVGVVAAAVTVIGGIIVGAFSLPRRGR